VTALEAVRREEIPLVRTPPGEWLPLHEEGDPVGCWFRWDGRSERFEIRREQEVGDLLEENRRLALLNDGYSRSRRWRRVAEVPLIFIHKWFVEEGWNALDKGSGRKLRQKLNDPDWRWLRTAPGRV
jgi:hypothetical protein